MCRNRAIYLVGDTRFGLDKFKHINPRKFMRIWARKEYFNLCRCVLTNMLQAGLVFLMRVHTTSATYSREISVRCTWRRLRQARVSCPGVYLVRGHVLLMELVRARDPSLPSASASASGGGEEEDLGPTLGKVAGDLLAAPTLKECADAGALDAAAWSDAFHQTVDVRALLSARCITCTVHVGSVDQSHLHVLV